MSARVTLVNPPYDKPVMRRYVASYFAPNFLLPPTDLLYVSAALKSFIGAKTAVVDAIARRMNPDAAFEAIRETSPDAVFFQLGFATIDKDLAFADHVKKKLQVPVVGMGYLPTLFSREVMEASTLDAIVRGEPEYAFTHLVQAWREGRSPADIAGVVWREGGEIREGPPPHRIENLDALPICDHGAVDANLYNETLLGRPVAAVFTARGCPFGCTFCVRTYGRKLVVRKAQAVVEELAMIRNTLGVPNIRFMDDTFNADRNRVLAICEGILKLQLLRWTSLARLDRLDEQLLALMKKSGCKRLYVGVESGSDKMLNLYEKGIDLQNMRRGIELIRKAGIESSGFFIVGGPEESRADFEKSVAFAKGSGLDYVIVTRMQYWPGTKLWEDFKESMETSIVPFYCRPADKKTYDRLLELEREFYRRFYLRPGYILKQLRYLLTSPRDLLAGFYRLARYVLGRNPVDFI